MRLLNAVNYTGLIEVEFKYDARDGRYKVLDLNPRVWGWHTLGARAGVDFSYLLWQMMSGKPVAEARTVPGVRWMRFSTDVMVGLREVMSGHLSLSGYLRSFRKPVESAIFAKDDPLPGLLELPLMGWLFARRLYIEKFRKRRPPNESRPVAEQASTLPGLCQCESTASRPMSKAHPPGPR